MTGTHPEPIGDASHGTDDRRPPDLGALRRSDALFDALSERRDVSSDDADDPAFALLKALVDDVDAGAPPLSRPGREGRGGRASRRRVPRTLVSLCVATTVLMSTGVAAAGGALSPFAPAPGGSEPHIRSRPDLPGWQGEATGGTSGSAVPVPSAELKRRQVSFPRGGEAAAGSSDDHPQSPRPTKPVTVSPSPDPTPYDLYAGPPDSPDPAPGTSESPDPAVDPSGTPGQSPGPGEERPGQGRAGQGRAGGSASGQGATP